MRHVPSSTTNGPSGRDDGVQVEGSPRMGVGIGARDEDAERQYQVGIEDAFRASVIMVQIRKVGRRAMAKCSLLGKPEATARSEW